MNEDLFDIFTGQPTAPRFGGRRFSQGAPGPAANLYQLRVKYLAAQEALTRYNRDGRDPYEQRIREQSRLRTAVRQAAIDLDHATETGHESRD